MKLVVTTSDYTATIYEAYAKVVNTLTALKRNNAVDFMAIGPALYQEPPPP